MNTTPATIDLGGPLAKKCTTCKAPPGIWCVLVRTPSIRAHALHAARKVDAPPVRQAGAGDLVLVRTAIDGDGLRHVLALLVDVGEYVRVRLWNAGAQAFARPRLVVRAQLVRVADDTGDERVTAALEYLQRLEPRRPLCFDTTAHGRIWITDVDAGAVRWAVIGSAERGMTARTDWARAALAGDIVPATLKAPTADEWLSEQLGRGLSCSPQGARALTTCVQKG